MHKAEEIQIANPKTTMVFLPFQWDEALIGAAERANTPVLPIYSFKAAKFLAAQAAKGDPVTAYELLNQALDATLNPQPAFLVTPGKKELWDRIDREALPLWDQFSESIVGLVQRGRLVVGVAYNYVTCVQMLAKGQVSSENDHVWVEAVQLIEQTIKPTWLGPKTPFFVTHIKPKQG